jgi:hypothetical protein
MDYRVFSMSSGEDEDSTEGHVFARAYRGAWRSIHGSEPAGRHEVAALELVIDFGGLALARGGATGRLRVRRKSRTAAPDEGMGDG